MSLSNGVNKVTGLEYGFCTSINRHNTGRNIPSQLHDCINWWYSGYEGDAQYITSINISKYQLPQTVTDTSFMFGNLNNLEDSVNLSHWDMSNVTNTDGMFVCCKKLSEVILPNTLTTIGVGMFGWCYSLTGLTIPNSVTTIYGDAFSLCYFENLTIPSSVTNIILSDNDNYQGFTNSVSVKNLVWESSAPIVDTLKVKLIKNIQDSDGVFVHQDMGYIESVVIRNQTTLPEEFMHLTQYEWYDGTEYYNNVYPEDVTDFNCSVTLGNTITSLTADTFHNIPLTSITFEGTMAQWNAITKDNDWFRCHIVCDYDPTIETSWGNGDYATQIWYRKINIICTDGIVVNDPS